MKKEAAEKAHILLDQIDELEKVLNYEKVEFNAQYYVLNISGTIKLPDSMQTGIKELIVNKIKDLETELSNL
ncbi:MAG: hypothetical protein WCS17_01385 [Prevotella sp.]